MKIRYKGGMPSGELRDPQTGQVFLFDGQTPIDVPDSFGRSVVSVNIGTDKKPNIVPSEIWEEVQ